MSDVGTSGTPPQGSVGGGGSPPAKEQAKEAASTAKAQTGEVASTAGSGAKKVASEATRQVSDLTNEASGHAREVFSQASGQLREQATEQTGRAAEGLRSLSGQVQALASGRPEEAGAVGDYAKQAGERLQQAASRLEEGGLDGLLDDLQGFARRRPGLFLFGAGAAGVVVGRLLRGAQAGSGQSSGQVETPERIGRLGRADGPFADVGEPSTLEPAVPPATADLSVAGSEPGAGSGSTAGTLP